MPANRSSRSTLPQGPTSPRNALRAKRKPCVSTWADYRAKLASIDADIARRTAERDSARELAGKLARTPPIAQRRAEDYKALVDQKFISEHGYLDREQAMIEQQGDLAFHTARVRELDAAMEEGRQKRSSLIAEFERTAIGQQLDANKRTAQLEQELLKARAGSDNRGLSLPSTGRCSNSPFTPKAAW